MFIGYWAAYSAYSAEMELPILPSACLLATELPTLPIQWELPTTCSLAGIELRTSSSRGKCTNHLANHALHGLLGWVFQKNLSLKIAMS